MSDSSRPHEPHAAYQAPPSMGFSRQGYWSGLPLPSPGCFMSQKQIKKSPHFERCLPLVCATTVKHSSIRLWHVIKSELYTTTGNDQLSGWTEKKLQSTSQSQAYTKKGRGRCLVVCCLSDPLQLSESQWNHYIWEEWSANQWGESKTAKSAGSIAQQKGTNSFPWQYPTARLTANASKVNKLGYKVLPHPPEVKALIPQSCLTLCDPMDCSQPGSTVHGISQARIMEWVAISFSGESFWPRDGTRSPALQADSTTDPPDLWPIDYHFFKHLHNFLQGKCFHKQQEAENAFQKFIESWTTDFYATGINISHW